MIEEFKIINNNLYNIVIESSPKLLKWEDVSFRTGNSFPHQRAYSFCLSDLSAERKVLFFLTRRGHVISPRQIEQTGEAVRTAPTSPPAGHVAIGEFPVT